MSSKHTLSNLPLPAASQLLTHNLTPDPTAPSFPAFRKLQVTQPSAQRRARLLDGSAHFAYTAPYPQPFPYAIAPPEPPAVVEDKAKFVEEWLASREAVNTKSEDGKDGQKDALRIHYPQGRDQTLDLIGLSERGLEDCLPHLDVGDAFDVLGAPTLSQEFNESESTTNIADESRSKARQELVDVLSGHATLMTGEDAATTFGPWSLRYSGHQFGSWAGQLGDGRAISVAVTPHPTDPATTIEIQLKGAGRTPFSRSADGLAVLRSSIREYLCSEAMHALRIPTTRSLTLIHLPSLPVARERMETACVLARVAPSFLRIGSFEALNGPTGMYFFGGGQQDPDLDALRKLGEWVGKEVLKLKDVNWEAGEPWGEKLVLEISRRNARMVGAWQVYGWMHGVLNTDNISVLGLTIDYGPYAFMDVFNQNHICNHSDDGGRYSYVNQPSMIVFAMRKLLNALAPIIGYESSTNKAPGPNWSSTLSADEIKTYTASGLELQDPLTALIQRECSEEYSARMHGRLGLRQQRQGDETLLSRPLLELMGSYRLDFHVTFRTLCDFEPDMIKDEGALGKFIDRLNRGTPDPTQVDQAAATGAWKTWLGAYAERIASESEAWKDHGESWVHKRAEEMRGQNPRFVLRQWVLEEVIKRVERDPDSGKSVLRKVLHMASSPFERYGDEVEEAADPASCPLDKEIAEERRFCGMGETKMLGFQCSCSS